MEKLQFFIKNPIVQSILHTLFVTLGYDVLHQTTMNVPATGSQDAYISVIVMLANLLYLGLSKVAKKEIQVIEQQVEKVVPKQIEEIVKQEVEKVVQKELNGLISGQNIAKDPTIPTTDTLVSGNYK